MDLLEALQNLNKAAYAASKAGADTTMYPDLDRQSLREIMWATDKLVDDNAPRTPSTTHGDPPPDHGGI